jgi:hypothetical protein
MEWNGTAEFAPGPDISGGVRLLRAMSRAADLACAARQRRRVRIRSYPNSEKQFAAPPMRLPPPGKSNISRSL